MKRGRFGNKDEYSPPYARSNATNVNEDKPQDRTRNKNSPKERDSRRNTGRFTPREGDKPGEKRNYPVENARKISTQVSLGVQTSRNTYQENQMD